VSEAETPVVQAVEAIGELDRKDSLGSQQNHWFLLMEPLSSCRTVASG